MSEQLEMKALVVVTKEVDGLEMGVLEDGTPYLSGRALAVLCDVAPSAVINQAKAWAEGGRTNKLARLIVDKGYNEPLLYIPTRHGAKPVNAYTDAVCMSFLEYYALEADRPSEGAKANYRKLAWQKFKEFVYAAVGYDPQNQISPSWRAYLDRVSMHGVPRGFFSVFKESAEFEVMLIRGGLPHDPNNVPDGSIGRTWSTHWENVGLDEKYGARQKADHNFPDSYPQADSNPQLVWIYPIDAIPEFRRWMESVYIPLKFPDYIKGKVKRHSLPLSTAELILKAVQDETLALPPAE